MDEYRIALRAARLEMRAANNDLSDVFIDWCAGLVGDDELWSARQYVDAASQAHAALLPY